MTNGNLSLLLLLGISAATDSSCASRKEVAPEYVEHVVFSPGENLTALTRITESSYVCDYPFGGDKGKDLFFTQHDNGTYSNIYRKENPIGASVSRKTSGQNHNMAPSYCAATDMVAFEGQLEGNTVSDIYMVNASLTNALTQVTNTPDAHECFPSLSRDGKRIAYERRNRHGNVKDSEIWVKNLQTNENKLLSLGRMPSFSSDGTKIVYVKYSSDGQSTSLCTINADGTGQEQLTDANMGVVWRPCFSPDGSHIVFRCTKQQKSDFDLYVVDSHGNGLTQLTINKSYDGEPYWANDGNIYFTSDRGGRDQHYQIWRFRYSGGDNIPPTPIESVYHIVSAGEKITDIAQKYGVTVREIVQWNNLKSMTLTTGMRLIVNKK